MKLILENWRQYLTEEKDYLYHGTSREFAQEMMDNGTAVETYWGDLEIAKDYAMSHENPVIVKVPLASISDELKPNMALIQQYEEMGDPDDLEFWNSSNKTALDSLEIFGSALLPSGVFLQGATINETPTF